MQPGPSVTEKYHVTLLRRPVQKKKKKTENVSRVADLHTQIRCT
jgi:hypothetical protein